VIKAIIFDLWDTLGTKQGGVSKSLSAKFSLPITLDYLTRYETAIQMRVWQNQPAMAVNLLKEFNIAASQENLEFVLELFRSTRARSQIYPGMKDLLVQLNKKYRLGVLSNTTFFESNIVSNWGIDDLFSAQVYSWQIESLKPAKKNFEVICLQLGVDLAEALLIDDNSVNISAAQRYGLSAIKFTGLDDLKVALKQFQIKTTYLNG